MQYGIEYSYAMCFQLAHRNNRGHGLVKGRHSSGQGVGACGAWVSAAWLLPNP